MDTIKVVKKKTQMVAHRGLSGLERENSIKAFVAAVNRSYYGTECDIHLTKDKVFVICHDDHTRRVSNYDVVIRDVTFEELQEVRLKQFNSDLTDRSLYLPTLDEYLVLHQKYNKQCVIEVKCELSDEEVDMLLSQVNEYLELVTFISFNIKNLQKIRDRNQDIRLQFLTSQYDDSLIPLLLQNKLDIDINYQVLNEANIKAFHDAKIIVNTWTINDKLVAEKLIDWGVDFITTNILE